MTKTCVICKSAFDPGTRTMRLTCSAQCQHARRRATEKAYVATPQSKELRRNALAAKPKPPRNCAWCGDPFESKYGRKVYCTRDCKSRSAEAAYYNRKRGAVVTIAPRAGPRPKMRSCQWCYDPFEVKHGLQMYCTPTCNKESRTTHAAEPPPTTCVQCNGPIANPSSKKKFCSGRCRKAAHIARFGQLDFEGEIVVKDLERSPRRLAVAKLFDRHEGEGTFYHGPTAPTWINPADRRHGGSSS